MISSPVAHIMRSILGGAVQLEEIAGRLTPLKELRDGQPYAALRALRPLLFLDDAPLSTLVQRVAAAAAAGRLRREDVLHALVQRAGLYTATPFLCSDPPSPARAQALALYSAAIDSDGPAAAVARVRSELEKAVGPGRGETAGPGAEGTELLKSILALTS
jgi:hypothetical protein